MTELSSTSVGCLLPSLPSPLNLPSNLEPSAVGGQECPPHLLVLQRFLYFFRGAGQLVRRVMEVLLVWSVVWTTKCLASGLTSKLMPVKLGGSSWKSGSMEATWKLGCAEVCAAIRRLPMET